MCRPLGTGALRGYVPSSVSLSIVSLWVDAWDWGSLEKSDAPLKIVDCGEFGTRPSLRRGGGVVACDSTSYPEGGRSRCLWRIL